MGQRVGRIEVSKIPAGNRYVDKGGLRYWEGLKKLILKWFGFFSEFGRRYR